MLYRVFSSLKTSVWLLSLMGVFYVLGTIFPQGYEFEDYIEAGGKFPRLVSTLDLLSVFTSPLFLFLTGLLIINLLVCIYDRFRRPRTALRMRRAMRHDAVDIGAAEELEGFTDRLKSLGFAQVESKDGMYLFKKGLPYWWLSWIYHLGIAVAIAGFMLTALTSFEKEVMLYPDRPERVSLYSPDTRLNRYLKESGLNVPSEKKEKEYTLKLKSFETEYYQTLRFEYPKGKLSRLAVGLGWRPEGFLEGKSGYSPRMWRTTLFVNGPGISNSIEAALWVNRPFRHGGLTLYQMGFEQKIKLIVSEKTIETESMKPFEVKGIKGKFEASIVRTGKLYKKDGTVENLKPFFELSFTPDKGPEKGPDKGKREKLGELRMGEPVFLKGRSFIFRELTEGSGLSYRVDRGVPIIGASIFLVFVGLLVRSLGYFYRVQLGTVGDRLLIEISTRGLLANKDRLTSKLKNP